MPRKDSRDTNQVLIKPLLFATAASSIVIVAIAYHLERGRILHDVGKIGTEDRILHKPVHLYDIEFGIMHQHMPHGLDIVDRVAWVNGTVPVVSGHR
jgi:response regulator RpfG family c-di-GMP phosphodiesterase